MTTLGGAPVTGRLALESVAWGTRLDLTCSYLTKQGGDVVYGGPTTYVMEVRRRSGDVDQVGTWMGIQGATMHLTGATSARRGNIAAVVVRTSEGQPVLRLAG